MEIETILVSAGVGFITSVITAYFTTRQKLKVEKVKWDREFGVKYAETQNIDKSKAQNIAKQFAIGVLVINYHDSSERDRIFIPPNCRLVAGRSEDNDINTNDWITSKRNTSFNSNSSEVYVEDLDSTNGTFLNDKLVFNKCILKTGDVIKLGDTIISYKKL